MEDCTTHTHTHPLHGLAHECSKCEMRYNMQHPPNQLSFMWPEWTLAMALP